MDVLKGFTAIKRDDDAELAKSIILQFLTVFLVFFVAIAGSVLVTNLYGCQAETQPAVDRQPRNLMIVPKGTMVGDYKTQSDGLYLSEQTVTRLVRKIDALEAAAKRGLDK